MAQTPNGQGEILAIGPGAISTFVMPCQWLAENICSAPACVDQAYQERRLLVMAIELEQMISSAVIGMLDVA